MTTEAQEAYDHDYAQLIDHVESIRLLAMQVRKEGKKTWADVGDMAYMKANAENLLTIMRGVAK